MHLLLCIGKGNRKSPVILVFATALLTQVRLITRNAKF